jgi:competence protein ComEC
MEERESVIRALILAFAMGAALLQAQAHLPVFYGLWLAPLALWLAILLPRIWMRRVAWLLMALGAGFYYAAGRAEWRMSERLDSAWEGRVVHLQGRVTGLVETREAGARWLLSLDNASRDAVPQRLRLLAPAKLGTPNLAGGDCIRVAARLYQPHASQNFGLPDYEAWLFERGIRAEGVAEHLPEPATGCSRATRAGLDRLREDLRQRLGAQLQDRPYAGVLIALALGDQQAISASQWRMFRDTGVTHLMSISGLHITLLSGLIYALVLRLWRRSAWLCLRLPALKAAALAGLVTACVYAALAGFGIPAQRTLYMVAAVALSLWLGWAHSPTRVLATALGLVVLIDPWAALSPGFWLSFGAVAALFYSGAGRLRPPRLIWAWGLTQWAATIGLLPLLVAWFNSVSLVSPLANAVAIPLISLVTVPLVVLTMLLPIPGLAEAAHLSLAGVMTVLDALGQLPQPVWSLATPPGWAMVMALAGVAIVLLPSGVLPRRWGAVLLLPLLWSKLEVPNEGSFELRLLDVGQGMAAIVQTARHTLVYDTGPRYRGGEDAGLRVVAPSLAALGVRRLDALVVSHADSDHDGGTASLIASHRPDWSLYGQPQPGQRRCVAGQRWTWDGVRFEVLHPPAHWAENPHIPDNDRSCVLKVGGRLLLTGDAAHLAELELVERSPALSDIAVVVAPHHGSRSSSSPALIARLRPQHVLISAGWRNLYGHPHPEVLARYREAATQVWRTDRQGALRLRFEDDAIQIETARNRQLRYWN